MHKNYACSRQHILDTAAPIIQGKGFAAVGLAEILQAAGVPKGSFYHYFKSKEAFGQALLESYFDSYLSRLQAILTDCHGGTAAQRLMRYWQLWVETQSAEGTEHKCMVVKLGAEVSDLSDPMRQALAQGTAQVIRQLRDCVDEGIADGSLPADLDAAQTAQSLYELWLGATMLTKVRRDRSALETALRTTQLLLRLPPQPAA